LSYIKNKGVKAGAVLNPSTPVVTVENVAGDVDFVLVMSVNPGFGGQSFIPHSVDKIRAVRALLDDAKNPAPVEVDGGIDEHTAALVVGAGAEVLVAGNAIFGKGRPEEATRALKAAAAEARKRGSHRV
jgi:ribulose-phosphate 3-epimerase